jgi:hypothetical protein
VTARDLAARERTADTMLLVHPGPTYAGVRVLVRNPGGRDTVQVLVRTVAASTGQPALLRGVTLEVVRDSDGAPIPGTKRTLDLSKGLDAPTVALPAPDEKTRAGFSAVVRDADGRLMSKAFFSAIVADDPKPARLDAPDIVRSDDTVFVWVGERAGEKRGGGLLAILGGGVQRALPLPGGTGRAEVTFRASESFYPDVSLQAAVAYPRRNEPAHLAWPHGAMTIGDQVRALEIAVDAPKTVAAGATITVRGAVRRVNGWRVPGVRGAITMVREAVLSRARYAELDAEIDFMRTRNYGSAHWDVFEEIVEPFDVTDGWPLGDLDGGGGGGGTGHRRKEPPLPAPEPRWRDATAVFLPDLAADTNATLTATFRAPATRGLYRIRVVASAPLPAGAPGSFGSANTWIDVR